MGRGCDHAGVDGAARRRRSTPSRSCPVVHDGRRALSAAGPQPTIGDALTLGADGGAGVELAAARVGSSCATSGGCEAQRDAAGGLHRARSALYLAPGQLHPLLAFTAMLCIALGAGGLGGDQQLVRRRHRPAHGAHPPAPDRRRADRAGRGAGASGSRWRSSRVMADGPGAELAGGGAAGARPSPSTSSSTRCG